VTDHYLLYSGIRKLWVGPGRTRFVENPRLAGVFSRTEAVEDCVHGRKLHLVPVRLEDAMQFCWDQDDVHSAADAA
jgi:hypothetical protein